jgi:hypothetical protein
MRAYPSGPSDARRHPFLLRKKARHGRASEGWATGHDNPVTASVTLIRGRQLGSGVAHVSVRKRWCRDTHQDPVAHVTLPPLLNGTSHTEARFRSCRGRPSSPPSATPGHKATVPRARRGEPRLRCRLLSDHWRLQHASGADRQSGARSEAG